MTTKHHSSSEQQRRRRLALLALAVDDSENRDPCPTAAELAELVERGAETKQLGTILAHVSVCENCYGHWLTLATLHRREQKRIRRVRFRPRLRAAVGSTLAVAVTVAVFLAIPYEQSGFPPREARHQTVSPGTNSAREPESARQHEASTITDSEKRKTQARSTATVFMEQPPSAQEREGLIEEAPPIVARAVDKDSALKATGKKAPEKSRAVSGKRGADAFAESSASDAAFPRQEEERGVDRLPLGRQEAHRLPKPVTGVEAGRATIETTPTEPVENGYIIAQHTAYHEIIGQLKGLCDQGSDPAALTPHELSGTIRTLLRTDADVTVRQKKTLEKIVWIIQEEEAESIGWHMVCSRLEQSVDWRTLEDGLEAELPFQPKGQPKGPTSSKENRK